MAQVQIIIAADAKEAIAELKKVAGEAERTGQAAKKGGEGFKQLGSTLDETVTKLKNLLTPANLLGGALGVGLVAGLRSAISATLDYVNELTRLQNITGASVSQLASLKQAADDLGVSQGSLQRSLFLMSNEIQTAGTGLARLGISIRDSQGHLKNEVDLLFEVSDKLKGMKDATAAANIARDIFGRGAAELLPVLLAGSARLKELGADAKRFGLDIGETGRKELKEFGIALNNVENAALGVKVTLIRDLSPAVKGLAETLASVTTMWVAIPKPIRIVIEVIAAVLIGFVALTAAIKVIGVALGAVGFATAAAGFASWAAPAAAVALAITGIVLAAKPLGALLATLLPESVITRWERFKTAIGGAWQAMVTWTKGKLGIVTDPFEGEIEDLAAGLAKRLSDKGPDTTGELQKRLAFTQQLTQAQVALAQATLDPIPAQIKGIQAMLALKLEELKVAKELDTTAVGKARNEQLRVAAVATAHAQITRLQSQAAIEDLNREATVTQAKIASITDVEVREQQATQHRIDLAESVFLASRKTAEDAKVLNAEVSKALIEGETKQREIQFQRATKQLELNAAMEEAAIAQFQTLEVAARNSAEVQINLAQVTAEQQIAFGLNREVAELERDAKIVKSRSDLAIKLREIEHEQFAQDVAIEQQRADTALLVREQQRTATVAILEDEQAQRQRDFEVFKVSQAQFVAESIRNAEAIKAVRLQSLDDATQAAQAQAEWEQSVARDKFKGLEGGERALSQELQKIDAALQQKRVEIAGQREQIERETSRRIIELRQQEIKAIADFAARATGDDLKTRLAFLDKVEEEHKGNARVLQAVEAERLRVFRQGYDRDVQDWIDAELKKTGIFQDENRKRLAQEAGLIQAQEQLRRQALDNAATVLEQTARQQGNLSAAFATGFAFAADAADDAFKLMRRAGEDAFRSLSSGLSDFLFDAITGAKSMGDAFLDVGKRILRSFLDLFTQIAVKQIAMMLGFNVLAQAGVAGATGGGGSVGSVSGGGGLLSLFSGGGGAGGVGGGFGIGNILSSLFGGLNSIVDWGLTQIFDLVTQGGTSFLGFGGSAAAGIAGNVIGNVVPIIGTAIAVVTNLLNGNIRGASLIGAGALIGSIIPGIGTAVGAIIGGLIDFIIDLFAEAPHAHLDVQLQSQFVTAQDAFMKGLVGSIGVFVSSAAIGFGSAESKRLEKEIADALSKIVRQLLGATLTAQSSLPASINETITRRLGGLAARSHMLDPAGNPSVKLEGELQQAIEALPSRLIKVFAEAVFGGLDISTLKRDGEELADTFIRVLNSMVGLSEILSMFGGNVDAIAASMGTGDAALAAFVQRSIAFFEQFRKEEEKFEDTLKRVVQAFGGMQQIAVSLETRIAELSGDSARQLALFQTSLVTADAQLQKLSDNLLIAFETGAQPDEILAMVQQLTDATSKRYQTEIQFVQQLAQALEALRVSGGQFLLQLQTTIGTLALQTGQGFGQFGLIGEFAPGMLSQLTTQMQLAFVPGLIEALRQAALTSIQEGQSLSGVFAGRNQLIGFGQGLFGALQGETDPRKALAGLQQLAAGVTQLLAGEIEATEAFYGRLIAQEQALAQTRLDALDQEKQALRDSEQAIQDEIRAIQEVADARLAPLKEEQNLLQEQLRVLQEQARAVEAWAGVISSVKAQLLQMRLTLDNPQNALERLRYAQELVGSARQRFLASPTPETARDLQDLLGEELRLAQQAFQRPSSAYKAIFDQITAELESIQALAEGNAGDLESLTREIAARQARLETLNADIAAIEREVADAVRPLDRTLTDLQRTNQERLRAIEIEERGIRETLATRIATLQAEQNAQIAQFRAEAVEWLKAIRDEALKRLEEAVAAGTTQLAALLGDHTLEEFIALKNQEQSDRLTEIRDALLTYLAHQGLEVPVSTARLQEAAFNLRTLAELAQGGGLTSLAQQLALTMQQALAGNLGGVISQAQSSVDVAWASGLGNTALGLDIITRFQSLIQLLQANQFQAAINGLAALVQTITQAGITTRVPVPGFQHGLPYVPYDEFPARLHRGERVLTAPENVSYSRAQGGGDVTVNVMFPYHGSARKDQFDRFLDEVTNDAKVGKLATVIRDAVKRSR